MRNRITELTRADIIERLLLQKEPFYGALDLIAFLKRIWHLDSMPSEDSRFKTAEGDIWQHMINNYDYDESYLLSTRLNITGIPDQQFARFLETCVDPLIVRDASRIHTLASLFNAYLKHDGFEMRAAGQISGRSIYKVVNNSSGAELAEAYEVVLSFAGEDRDYVEQVARVLKENGVELFYDAYEEATLWGKNLQEHLHKVYSGSARHCVMFISSHYAEKVWPTVERRSAFQKAIETKEEYILPARFDDTEIPGLLKTIGYVDLRNKTANQLAMLICTKLGRVYSQAQNATKPIDNDTQITDEDIPF